MAKGFRIEAHIDRPPEMVWAAMADIEGSPRWMKGVEAVRALDESPMAPGKRFVTGLSTPGSKAEREMILSAWNPPTSFALSSTDKGVTATYAYGCEAEGTGTRVTLDAQCQGNGLIWRLMHPLILRIMARHDGGQLAALKALIEAEN